MSPRIAITDLSAAWYRRPQYAPRVGAAGERLWFLLAPAFRPPEDVTADDPREPSCGRSAMLAAFAATAQAWRLPRDEAQTRALEALRQNGTAIVVTGQQPGFLGGPLHTFYKAVTAVAAARRRAELTGKPCVPVFWVAADDHDLDEVREARFPGTESGEASFAYPHAADRRPLGEYAMDAPALVVVAQAQAHFGVRRHGELVRDLLEEYRERSFAAGFAALVSRLLGPHGLLLLDSAQVRPLAAGVVRAAIEAPEALLARIEEGRQGVAALGIEPFVAGRLPLFLLRDGRRDHLSPAPGALQVDGGGPRYPREELLSLLHEDPMRFSTGALLRPMVQELCLPCAMAVGGPAEIGYFAQLGPLADHLGSPRPRIGLRLNGTMVDGKLARRSSELPPSVLAEALTLEALLPGASAGAVAALSGLGADLEARLLEAVSSLPGGDDRLRLERKAREARADVDRLADRIEKQARVATATQLDQTRRLWDHMFPGGVLQERRWGVLHFIARHGTEWIGELIEHEARAPLRLAHRWIALGD